MGRVGGWKPTALTAPAGALPSDCKFIKRDCDAVASRLLPSDQAMRSSDEPELSHLKEPMLSYTPYSLVDPAQHQPLAARGRLCRAALLVSSVMVIGSLFVTKVGLDSRDAVSLASVVASGHKKSPAPLSVKDPVSMGFPPFQ